MAASEVSSRAQGWLCCPAVRPFGPSVRPTAPSRAPTGVSWRRWVPKRAGITSVHPSTHPSIRPPPMSPPGSPGDRKRRRRKGCDEPEAL